MTIDIKNNEMVFSPELRYDHQTLYQKALQLGQIFSREPVVAKVGIYGSLARNEKSSADIDLLIFVQDPALVKRTLMVRADEARDRPILIDPEDYLEEVFLARLSDAGRFKLFRTLLEKDANRGLVQYPVDYFLLPYPIPDVYIEIEAKANRDPRFLATLARDALVFDPIKNAFAKEKIFTTSQADKIGLLAKASS